MEVANSDERNKAEYSVEADSFIERVGMSDINLSELELNMIGELIITGKRKIDAKCANIAKEIAKLRKHLQDINFKLKNGWRYSLISKGVAHLTINNYSAAIVECSYSAMHIDRFSFHLRIENDFNLINLYDCFKLPHEFQEKSFFNYTERASSVNRDDLKKEMQLMLDDFSNDLKSTHCWGEPLIQQFLTLDIDRLMEGVI